MVLQQGCGPAACPFLLSVFNLGILACPSVPAQTHYTEESLAEYAAAHLRHAFTSVDEYHRHFLNLEAYLVCRKLHLYLEAVALEAYLVQLNGLEHAALVALKSRSGVVHLEARHHAHILRCKIAHQHSSYRPVHHVHSAHVARAYGNVVALVVACRIEARQVVGVVTEVGVHLEYIVISVLQGPFKARYVCRAQAQLAAALNDKQTVGKLALHQSVNYSRGAVGRAVVYHENIKTFFKREHRPYNLLDVLFLVIRRYNDYAVAFVHVLNVFCLCVLYMSCLPPAGVVMEPSTLLSSSSDKATLSSARASCLPGQSCLPLILCRDNANREQNHQVLLELILCKDNANWHNYKIKICQRSHYFSSLPFKMTFFSQFALLHHVLRNIIYDFFINRNTINHSRPVVRNIDMCVTSYSQ